MLHTMHQSANYSEIKEWVQQEFGFEPKPCWIAHCRELHGLPVRVAWNPQGKHRLVPCPPEKLATIKKAFQHFGMLP